MSNPTVAERPVSTNAGMTFHSQHRTSEVNPDEAYEYRFSVPEFEHLLDLLESVRDQLARYDSYFKQDEEALQEWRVRFEQAKERQEALLLQADSSLDELLALAESLSLGNGQS